MNRMIATYNNEIEMWIEFNDSGKINPFVAIATFYRRWRAGFNEFTYRGIRFKLSYSEVGGVAIYREQTDENP